jgi:hypothetical protein
MDGSPARSNVPNHQLHIAGEEGGSATMVAVFCRFFCVVAGCGISSSSSYVAFGTKKTKGGAGAVLLSVPHWRAPHLNVDAVLHLIVVYFDKKAAT